MSSANGKGPSQGLVIAIALAAVGALVVFGSGGCLLPRAPWNFNFHGGWPPVRVGLVGLAGLLQIALALWVGLDANRRGFNGWLWGLLVFFTHIVGLIIYLIAAPMLPAGGGGAEATRATEVAPSGLRDRIRCAECGGDLESGFKVCPHCGTAVGCRECARPLRPGWKVCPYCAAPTGSSRGTDPAAR